MRPITYRMICLCTLANFINSADRAILPIAIIQMSTEYRWSLNWQGWILSSFSYGYIASQIIGTSAASKFGAGTILTLAVFIWSWSMLLTPFVAESTFWLMFFRILLGLGEGLGLPMIFQLYAANVPISERSRAFSYLISAGTIGQMFAALITPHVQWRWMFYKFGTAGIVWCWLWFRFYHRSGNTFDHFMDLLPTTATGTKTMTKTFTTTATTATKDISNVISSQKSLPPPSTTSSSSIILNTTPTAVNTVSTTIASSAGAATITSREDDDDEVDISEQHVPLIVVYVDDDNDKQQQQPRNYRRLGGGTSPSSIITNLCHRYISAHWIWAFLYCWPLWAIYIAHFAMNWSNYIIMQWFPYYMSRHLGADSSSLSLTALPYVFNSIAGVGAGHLADSLITDHKWPLLSVRRLMTTTALLGAGLCMLSFTTIHSLSLAIFTICVAMSFCALNSAGHLSNHSDVAPHHAGLSFAISNTIATIPGLLCGPLTAELVMQSQGRWLPVFTLAAAINFVGAVIYASQSTASQVIG